MHRLRLAHLPTPLEQPARLGEALGVDLWVKRDDATGGAEAGNKVRKLEMLLAQALEQGCDRVVTCGGVQSNHARATAVAAASLGLATTLLLRLPGLTDDRHGAGLPLGESDEPLVGNLLLDRLAGAEVRLITAQSYEHSDELMARLAAELRAKGQRPYVIPEGGSNGLGALGYVEAMAEISQQLDAGQADGKPFDLVIHACGSGGTAAGTALGARQHGVAAAVCAMAVCSDAESFRRRIADIIGQARALDRSLGPPLPIEVDDRARGPAYAVASPEQRATIVEVARLSGLILDPVYTGKAMWGLWQRCQTGELHGKRVLFLHTGGLPGLLAQAEGFGALR